MIHGNTGKDTYCTRIDPGSADKGNEDACRRSEMEDLTGDGPGLRTQTVPVLTLSSVRSGGLFYASAVGMAVLDPDGCLLQVNDRFCMILGYAEKKLLSRRLSDFAHPDDPNQFVHRISGLSRETANQYVCEARYLNQTGKTVWCEESVTALGVEKEKKPAYLLQWQERTSEKHLKAQVQAGTEERAVLLREVHHRVRNNLQIISSLLSLQSRFAHLCTAQEMNAKFQSRIQSIALVHNLMFHTNKFTDIHLNEFVVEVFRNLKNTHYRKAKDINLNVNLDSVRLNIETAIPLGLILNELLSNAVLHAFPFMKPGESVIEVQLQQLEQNTIELRVSDNGIGFLRDLDLQDKETLGLHLVTLLAKEQLGGTIQFCKNRGSHVIIQFFNPVPDSSGFS